MITRVTLSSPEALRDIDSSVYADGDILMASMTTLMLGHLTVALFRIQSGWTASGEVDDGVLFIKSSVEVDRYWERVVKGLPAVHSSGSQSVGPLSSYIFTHASDPDRRRLTRIKFITVNTQTLGEFNFSPTLENVTFIDTNPHMYPFDWSNKTIRLNGGLLATREGANLYPSGYSDSDIYWNTGLLESNGNVTFIGNRESDYMELMLRCISSGTAITAASVKEGNVGNWFTIRSVYGSDFAVINTISLYPTIQPGAIGSSTFAYDGDPLGGYEDYVSRAVCCLPDGSMIGTKGTLSAWQWGLYEPNDDEFVLFEKSGSSWNDTYLEYIGGTAARTSAPLDGWPFAPYTGRFVVNGTDYGGSYYNKVIACWIVAADGSSFNFGGSGNYYEQPNGASINTAANPLNGIAIVHGIFFDENKYHYRIGSFTTNTGGMAGGLQTLGDFQEAWDIKTQQLSPLNAVSLFPSSNAMLDGYFNSALSIFKIEDATYPEHMAAVADSREIIFSPAIDVSTGVHKSVAFSGTKYAALYKDDNGWNLYTYSLSEDTNFKSTAVLLKDVIKDAVSITSITPNTTEPAGTSIRYLVENSAGASFWWNSSSSHWESRTDITTGNTTAQFTAANHALLLTEVGPDVSINVALITDGTDTPELTGFTTNYSRGEDFVITDEYMQTFADSATTTRVYNTNSSLTYTFELDVFLFP